jgi:hypothetical protein
MGISIISYGKKSLDLRPTNLIYDQPSRTNWVPKSKVHCIRNGLFPSGLPIKMLCAIFLPLTPSTFPVHTFYGAIAKLLVDVSRTHTAWHIHAFGLAWTSDQPVTETATYTTHNKHQRRTFMPSAGFKPAIPASERLQTYTLDRMATGIGFCPHIGPILTLRLPN